MYMKYFVVEMSLITHHVYHLNDVTIQLLPV